MTNGFVGPMGPTRYLRSCPYIMEVMTELGAVWGRSRLMGLAPGAKVPAHVDGNYHWRTHLRVHIPVITTPKVTFNCGGETVHMAPGECWIFDSFRVHGVFNAGTEKRVHLVLDTVGGEEIWDLVDEAGNSGVDVHPKLCPPGQKRTDNLAFERVNAPSLMSPWEVRAHVDYIFAHMLPDARLGSVSRRLDRFVNAWTGTWAEHGAEDDGVPHYQRLIVTVQRDLQAIGASEMKLHNGIPFMLELAELIFKIALPVELTRTGVAISQQ